MNQYDENNIIKEAYDILKSSQGNSNNNNFMAQMLYNIYKLACLTHSKKEAVELSCTLLVNFMLIFSKVNCIGNKDK